jgi:putative flippase GtrA
MVLARVRLLLEGRRGALIEALRFVAVGAVAGVATIAVFNLLVYAGGAGPLNEKPITAYWIAFIVGVAVAYLGNLRWTFGGRGAAVTPRSVGLFIAINLVSLAFPSLCLAVSRYGLGLDGPLADNISANVFGLALAMVFRFVSYRLWVFARPSSPEPPPQVQADPEPELDRV